MITKLKYFWIAEYNDGNALPQFDPETGIENLFKNIDQTKLIRFGLYPFTMELSKKVNCSDFNPFLRKIVINLDGNKLIFKRRNYIIIQGIKEKRHIEYLLGTKDYILYIDESGNLEVKKE
jgi:hypothetical protein